MFTITVLAGVNGSGKSSIIESYLRTKGVVSYNPDTIARQYREAHPNVDQTFANAQAWASGKSLLEKSILEQRPFVFETTLGGQTITRILKEAPQAGATLNIIYIGLQSVELNIDRVKRRVQAGGHDIAESKIRERWNASRRNLLSLIPVLSSLRVFDNSLDRDPENGEQPEPTPIIDVKDRRILHTISPELTPEWSKPIVAATHKTFS